MGRTQRATSASTRMRQGARRTNGTSTDCTSARDDDVESAGRAGQGRRCRAPAPQLIAPAERRRFGWEEVERRGATATGGRATNSFRPKSGHWARTASTHGRTRCPNRSCSVGPTCTTCRRSPGSSLSPATGPRGADGPGVPIPRGGLNARRASGRLPWSSSPLDRASMHAAAMPCRRSTLLRRHRTTTRTARGLPSGAVGDGSGTRLLTSTDCRQAMRGSPRAT